MYLNLVEGRLWVPAVGGSNPSTPTKAAARSTGARVSPLAAAAQSIRFPAGTNRSTTPNRTSEAIGFSKIRG